MRDCQNYGPFLGPYDNTGPNTGPNLGDPKRDHNFDNPPHDMEDVLISPWVTYHHPQELVMAVLPVLQEGPQLPQSPQAIAFAWFSV